MMAKLLQGRLAGAYGMTAFTATELYEAADRQEAEANSPEPLDDPRYLRRWARKQRQLARLKEKALKHKTAQRRASTIRTRSRGT